ncbi:MAG: PAS domain S-box protein [Phycisphaerae bacterium]
MSQRRPTYQELEKRLAVAEPIIEVLKRHEVDAVVGEEKITFLLLREVEYALLNSDAELRTMFELSGIGMFQADTPALRFAQVNQKFCEMAGYAAAELLTKTYLGLTHPHDCQRDMNGIAPVLRGQSDTWSIEKRCLRKDGSTIWVSVHGAAVRDDTGRIVRIVAMINDLTARKETEQELRDQAAQLRKLTAELRRLRKAAVTKVRGSARKKKMKPLRKPRLKKQ